MSRKVYLTKIFNFSAAHKLNNYQGRCANLHGHTWRVHVTVSGFIDNDGFVIDFSEIKGVVLPIIDLLDHSYLNHEIKQPTAENICIYIYDKLYSVLKEFYKHITLESVKVYESETSYTEVKK